MPLLLLANATFAPLPAGPPLAPATTSVVNYTVLGDITSADWSLMIDATATQQGLATGVGSVVEGFADVNQCIAIILNTPKGSDPLRPTFGCDIWQYIDAPMTLAVPHLVREVTEALTIWEPRISVLAVTATPSLTSVTSQSDAALAVTITWQLKLGTRFRPSSVQQNVVTITISPRLVN
jgi:phage baseplate assembly protein W